MKTIRIIVLLFALFCVIDTQGQVTTDFNNPQRFTEKGKFNKEYSKAIDVEIPAKNINLLLEQEENELKSTGEEQPFKIATAVPVDIDIAQRAKWASDGVFSKIKFHQIEIEPLIRWDNYPTFTNAINSISIYDLSIKGTSWGVNAAYKLSFKNGISFKTGLGYYRYAFNNIVSMHRLFGEGNQRRIDYPTSLDLIVTTDSYSYNTTTLLLAIEKNFELRNNFSLSGGLTIRNYFTFSQHYHLPYGNLFENNYKTFRKDFFGLGGELNIGIVKKIGKLSIGPSIIIPVYDSWSQDSIFPTENNSGNRNKWFRGIGTSFKVIYTFKRNHHEN